MRVRANQREGELHGGLGLHVDAALAAAELGADFAAVDGRGELDRVQPEDLRGEHEVGVLQGRARGERRALEPLAGRRLELEREGGGEAALPDGAHAVEHQRVGRARLQRARQHADELGELQEGRGHVGARVGLILHDGQRGRLAVAVPEEREPWFGLGLGLE